ncbi:MAG TPA: DUF6491 family protein [Steroidobacteraceae bacterium]
MKSRIALLWLMIAGQLAACSAVSPDVKRRDMQARYLAYAGAPIDSFTYLGRYDNWTALNPSQLVIWTNITDAYLLTSQPPCTGLQFANRIGVSSTAGTVNRGLDSVLFAHQRCPITEIRPVDYKRMLADRRAAAH